MIKKPLKHFSKTYYTGVDLGTACVVLAVLDEDYKPVAGAYRYADVVRDGMVVDYIGAVELVRELKEELEQELNTELIYAAASLPPGTDELDGGAIKNVVQSAGFELTNLLDEPTAANRLLQVTDGAVVDIGGGTTGISIVENSQVIKVADEATGGTHLSLVISGAYKLTFEAAEKYKQNKQNHDELLHVLKPVIEKISSIVIQQTKGYNVDGIYLVGGTACLKNIETIIEKTTGIPTYKPTNPMFVTPLGIALSCTDQVLT
ncbi:ethanolamine utilization protein EutJ family protein [Enterococcus caccae]|nr:ethanolamine utilization protein EutJ family protein [Enterococcus caccae]